MLSVWSALNGFKVHHPRSLRRCVVSPSDHDKQDGKEKNEKESNEEPHVKAATVAGATAGDGDGRRCGIVGCDHSFRGCKAGAAHHLEEIAGVVVAGFATLAFLHQRLHTLF